MKIFLLGGHDLEMQEISVLLEQNKVLYFDRQLNWENSRLDVYATELEKYGNRDGYAIYGVELSGTVGGMDNYVLIDHHNEYSEKKASLLQVAEVLGMSLNRYQRLVAANDAAYIPGMQAMGATLQEIADIRLKDRAAQGITEEDERLARKAICENLEKWEDLILVRALSSRFSPVCDRLWPYQKLLIYTDESLCYYGVGKQKLAVYFERELIGRSMYHGGGKNGFIGTVKGMWNSGEISLLIEQVLNIIQNL